MTLEELLEFLGDKGPKPNPFTMAMGKLIRKAREEAGLSQGNLAEKIHRRRATLTDLENGNHELDVTTLALLAAALHKPIPYFFPPQITEQIDKDDLSASEQELILEFRQLRVETLERIAIQQIRTLAQFDPHHVLEGRAEAAPDPQELMNTLKEKWNQRSK